MRSISGVPEKQRFSEHAKNVADIFVHKMEDTKK